MYTEEIEQRNIMAILDHSNKTRDIVRDLETQVNEYKALTVSLNEKIEMLKTQVQQLQVKLYTGSAVNNL